MRISNHLSGACAIAGCLLSGLTHADDLTLADGEARLTGDVRSISSAGVVTLLSELSPDPVLLKSEGVGKIEFTTDAAIPDPPGAMVELANGDILPVTVESFDDHNLTVLSPAAGRLAIRRDALKSLQLGVRNFESVYSGPQSLAEWTQDDGSAKNWEFKNQRLISDGQAAAARKFDLPKQFILRFTLKWGDKQNPNFQIFFADPLLPMGERCDRYSLQFTGAGLDIRREAATKKRYNPIVLLNRVPSQYPDRTLRVELRVFRNTSKLQLFLNGEPEGEWADLIPSVPTGSGIALVCNTPSGGTQEISGLEILKLDDARGRHHSEERGDLTEDSLISREDDRWSGHLSEIRKSSGEPLYLFKSDFQEEPLEIPGSDVSTVFFAGEAAAPKEKDAGGFLLRLHGGGSLRVGACEFEGETVSTTHPLLGPLKFRLDGILSIERVPPETGDTTEP